MSSFFQLWSNADFLTCFTLAGAAKIAFIASLGKWAFPIETPFKYSIFESCLAYLYIETIQFVG